MKRKNSPSLEENVILYEIGVDRKPSNPGVYNIQVENIMVFVAGYAEFDGNLWKLPISYWNKRIWWSE